MRIIIHYDVASPYSLDCILDLLKLDRLFGVKYEMHIIIMGPLFLDLIDRLEDEGREWKDINLSFTVKTRKLDKDMVLSYLNNLNRFFNIQMGE